MGYIPHVIEMNPDGHERAYDVYSRLLKDRIIMLSGVIEPEIVNGTIAQILFLSNQDPDSDIKLYISSPGGSISAGMALYDTMQLVRNDIQTYCVGMCASMASVLFAGGTKGKRRILPHSTVMIHQPLMNGLSGQATDIQIHAKEILRWKSVLNEILAERTGQSLEIIERDVERDFYLTAREAVQYGLCDEIIGLPKSSKPSSVEPILLGTLE